MQIDQYNILGAVDKETRCEHYYTKNDIIAIKFYCCGNYFPCYLCHEKYGCGYHTVWPREHFNQKSILCGACKDELTIHEYFNNENRCPSCGAQFNAGCILHHHLYFDKYVK